MDELAIVPVLTQSERERFCALPGLPRLPAESLDRHGSDEQWMAVDAAGAVRARCSLWWTRTPALSGERLGLIGHYAAEDEGAGTRLLDIACERLEAAGATLAVGPMDGNTWQRYRLLTERGSEPPFFLEPDNPDDWPSHFHQSGFEALAHYRSAMCSDLSIVDPRLERVAERLTGVAIRPLDLDHFDDELGRIYAVSEVSFQRNFLYSPIALADFVQQYRPIAPVVRPELVLLAESQGTPVGFLFAIPDVLQARSGRPIDTVIVKTVAILPGRRYAGLGNLLVARCHETAERLGYTRAIHALMHDSNDSRNLSGRYAVPIRKYVLYARRIRRGRP